MKNEGCKKVENINWSEPSTISVQPIKQPNGFIKTLKLYEYQLKGVSWYVLIKN